MSPRAIWFAPRLMAFGTVFFLVGLAVLAVMFRDFWIGVDPDNFRARNRWVLLGDGWVGTVFVGGLTIGCAWFTVTTLWRLVSSRPALGFSSQELHIHPSFLTSRRIPLRTIEEVKIKRTKTPRSIWFLPDRKGYLLEVNIRLDKGIRRRRRLVVGPPQIDGGLRRMCRFARGLNRARANV
jgi:hypothetical protein